MPNQVKVDDLGGTPLPRLGHLHITVIQPSNDPHLIRARQEPNKAAWLWLNRQLDITGKIRRIEWDWNGASQWVDLINGIMVTITYFILL